MYIIISCYYKYGESHMEQVEDGAMRNFCLKKIEEYADDLQYYIDKADIYDDECDDIDDILEEMKKKRNDDSGPSKEEIKELVEYYNYARLELKSKNPKKLEQYEHYTLERLIDFVKKIGEIIISKQSGYGIRYIIHGEDLVVC